VIIPGKQVLLRARHSTVLLGVVFGAFSAIALFIAGSLEIFDILREYLLVQESQLTHEHILITIIGAIDFYLIGLVLLIFQFRHLRTLYLPA
jgi:uncharacterized membrane protein YqhA